MPTPSDPAASPDANTQAGNPAVTCRKAARSRPTDRYKEHLTERDLDAARRERKGEVVRMKPGTNVPYDHLTEVREAQQGLLARIEQINRKLGSPSSRLTEAQRIELVEELGDASRLLDYSRHFVPGT
jgi:hypothetical protein